MSNKKAFKLKIIKPSLMYVQCILYTYFFVRILGIVNEIYFKLL